MIGGGGGRVGGGLLSSLVHPLASKSIVSSKSRLGRCRGAAISQRLGNADVVEVDRAIQHPPIHGMHLKPQQMGRIAPTQVGVHPSELVRDKAHTRPCARTQVHRRRLVKGHSGLPGSWLSSLRSRTYPNSSRVSGVPRGRYTQAESSLSSLRFSVATWALSYGLAASRKSKLSELCCHHGPRSTASVVSSLSPSRSGPSHRINQPSAPALEIETTRRARRLSGVLDGLPNRGHHQPDHHADGQGSQPATFPQGPPSALRPSSGPARVQDQQADNRDRDDRRDGGRR
jgi:hypothetical protein